MSIGIIDTTILCNIVQIPGMCSEHAEVMQQLRQYVEQGVIFLLPVTTIMETGNHIAQNGDGQQRRQTAERFSKLVTDAINGNAPWTIPSPFLDTSDLAVYLQEYPDHAMRKIGLGDLSIIKEFHHQCALHPERRIFIWSLDEHLRAYERDAPGWVQH